MDFIHYYASLTRFQLNGFEIEKSFVGISPEKVVIRVLGAE